MSRYGQYVQELQEAKDADLLEIEQFEQRCEYLEEQHCENKRNPKQICNGDVAGTSSDHVCGEGCGKPVF